MNKRWTTIASLALCAAAATGQIVEDFRNPGPEFRGKPFWSWNGELTQQELNRQMRVLKDMGMGGFFMHSRTGLKTEYLGEDWFRLIESSAGEAQRLGMEAWLYDEDRWPSGTAGGLVTQKPEYRQKFIGLHTFPAAAFEWPAVAVAVFACDLSGTSFTHCARLSEQTPPGPGSTVLVFSVEEMDKSPFYNGYTYADTLNREATDYFIKLTHEKYRKHLGAQLGTTVKGIFTDEPHRGAAFTGFGMSNPNRLRMTPWTEALPVRFRERFGYDLVERLPELFFYKNGEHVAPVKWHYMELLQSMFLENWARPIHEWCQANRMVMTGHVLHEDSLTAQAAMQGSLMRFYEHMDYPGVDVLAEGNRNYWIVKQVASVARQLGQPRILSELYGVTGWQFNFESHKYVGDWQALFGVNLRCHHLSWYTMGGEAKRDYPASISFQSAWWKDYKFVEDYYARLNLLLSQGEPLRDVLVLNPVESVWAQVGVGWAEGLDPSTKPLQELERSYQEMFSWLAGSHIDFDYGDEEMLGRLGKVERDADGHAMLRVGKAVYRVAVVPRMTTIRGTSLSLLDEFRKAGGRVVFAGPPPAYVDAITSSLGAQLAAKSERAAWSREAVAAACKPAIAVPVEILDDAGRTLESVFCQLREGESGKTLVAMNMDREKWFKRARIRVRASGAISEWDCQHGERFSVATQSRDGWTEWAADFAPLGEHGFVLENRKETEVAPKPSYREVMRQTLAGPFEYQLSEPNVCVLDMARYRIKEGKWNPETEILKIDRAVRTAFDLPMRGGDMVQPWFSLKYEPKPLVKGRVTMAFDFAVEHLPEGAVTLAIEQPGNFLVRLNGREISVAPDGWWVDPAIKTVRLPMGLFIKGANQVELETDFRKDVTLEAVYLLGSFGMRVDGTKKTLIKLPARLAPSDVVAQGLPFYTGAITYHVPLTPRSEDGRRTFVSTPKFEAACVKVKAGRQSARTIAWQPYEAEIPSGAGEVELEVVLTRRNTFGPLHLLPMRSSAYGPEHFVTEGNSWSQAYQLYPSGLLAAPMVWVGEAQQGGAAR